MRSDGSDYPYKSLRAKLERDLTSTTATTADHKTFFHFDVKIPPKTQYYAVLVDGAVRSRHSSMYRAIEWAIQEAAIYKLDQNRIRIEPMYDLAIEHKEQDTNMSKLRPGPATPWATNSNTWEVKTHKIEIEEPKTAMESIPDPNTGDPELDRFVKFEEFLDKAEGAREKLGLSEESRSLDLMHKIRELRELEERGFYTVPENIRLLVYDGLLEKTPSMLDGRVKSALIVLHLSPLVLLPALIGTVTALMIGFLASIPMKFVVNAIQRKLESTEGWWIIPEKTHGADLKLWEDAVKDHHQIAMLQTSKLIHKAENET